MNLMLPQARYRIYTSPGSYFSFFRDLFSGSINTGDGCQHLETEIGQRFSVNHALCMPQARVGIYLTIKALIRPGQNVILSPYTIADVINMVICAGGTPVFADIDRRTCNIDPAQIEQLIDKHTGAVMITHLHGLACPIDQIMAICKHHKVPLIEDAAQAFGSTVNGQLLGTFGDAGIFSFGMYKNITSFFGGMVVTPHQDLHKKIKQPISRFPATENAKLIKKVTSGLLTDLATSPPLFQLLVYHIFRFGHMHRIKAINRHVETELDLTAKDTIPETYLRQLTDLQARLILCKLGMVNKDNQTRQKYASIYHEELKEFQEELLLPPLPGDGSHIYTYYPVQYRDRSTLVRWMMQNYRDLGVQHLKNCADLPAFKKYFRDCPKARATADQVILLPTYPRYTEKQVRRNTDILRLFFSK